MTEDRTRGWEWRRALGRSQPGSRHRDLLQAEAKGKAIAAGAAESLLRASWDPEDTWLRWARTKQELKYLLLSTCLEKNKKPKGRQQQEGRQAI